MDKALGSSRIDCEFSGSTSVVSFLKGKTLTTAWVGDSRGVLGRSKKGGGYEAVPLTKDHKPTAPEEKARIVATNGRVERSVSAHTLTPTLLHCLLLLPELVHGCLWHVSGAKISYSCLDTMFYAYAVSHTNSEC